MKKISLIAAAILMMTFSAAAQGGLADILSKIGQKAKDVNAGDIVTSITRTTCLVSLTENDFDLKLIAI